VSNIIITYTFLLIIPITYRSMNCLATSVCFNRFATSSPR